MTSDSNPGDGKDSRSQAVALGKGRLRTLARIPSDGVFRK